MNPERLNAAVEYHRQALHVIPLKDGDKVPVRSGLYDEPMPTFSQLEDYFAAKGHNIGVLCGARSSGFFVVDVDDRRLTKKYHEELQPLIKKNAPVVETARGYHFWTRCPEAASVQWEKIRGIDFKYYGHVVAPPSLHPSGQLYLFRDDLSAIPEIQLEEFLFKKTTREEGQIVRTPAGVVIPAHDRPYGLSPHLFAILHGNIGKYPSRSEAEAALVTYCANNGWTFENVKQLFDVQAWQHSKYKEKGKHGTAYLAQIYSSALKYLSTNRSDIDKKLDALTVWAENPANWKGRTAHTDRSVFLAFLSISRRCGKIADVYASRREIAELAGIGREPARAALHRIPFLKLVRKDVDPFTPAVWSIDTEQVLSNVPNPAIPIQSLCITGGKGESLAELTRHDLFRYTGLGKAGAVVWLAIGDTFRGIPEIGTLAGVPRRTVYRKIDVMKQLHLVEVQGKGYAQKVMRAKGANLDAAAELMGTAGAAKKQRALHRNERKAVATIREAYRESLAVVKH
jgi:hypothetical protein